MSDASIRLLLAAVRALGGEAALAAHLKIDEERLRASLESRAELPDALLLRAMDAVLRHPDPHGSLALQDAIEELKSRFA